MQTYDENKNRQIPRSVLQTWDGYALGWFIDGYLEGDGHASSVGRLTPKVTMSTVSARLADDLQEAAALAGGAIQYARLQTDRESAFGDKPVHHLTVIQGRNAQPRIGWTVGDRAREVTAEHYEGKIHCVTVPNGTLYVRRNGKSLWCGNSPFEHVVFTWRVTAPLFVWREHHRHRIASYNEESSRYRQLAPHFYLPAPERNLVQVGKPGAYSFEPGSVDQYTDLISSTQQASLSAYRQYEMSLDAGIAREVARVVLPVNIMSTCYVTMNARALMNFLSLRTKSEDAMFVSYPQREIEMVAEEYEKDFMRLCPITHEAFHRKGRVAP
jgi:thymidylate synthase (FAD)